MQYLRSRQAAKAGGRVAKGSTIRTEKVPAELKDKVEMDPNKWFNIWLKCGRSWGKVLITESKLERSTGYEMLGGKEEDGCVRPFC